LRRTIPLTEVPPGFPSGCCHGLPSTAHRHPRIESRSRDSSLVSARRTAHRSAPLSRQIACPSKSRSCPSVRVAEVSCSQGNVDSNAWPHLEAARSKPTCAHENELFISWRARLVSMVVAPTRQRVVFCHTAGKVSWRRRYLPEASGWVYVELALHRRHNVRTTVSTPTNQRSSDSGHVHVRSRPSISPLHPSQ